MILTIVTVAGLFLLHHTERGGLNELTAKATGQTLQRSQVLDLQVIGCNVALLNCPIVEVTEEFLEHVVDPDASQNVALFNVAVQGFWDEVFVTGGDTEKKTVMHMF